MADTMSYLDSLAKKADGINVISTELYTTYDVKRGLRDKNGTGVLVGLTDVGCVVGYRKDEAGNKHAIPGKLYYRGMDLEDICAGFQAEGRQGFEETAYLLLFGKLPTAEELADFNDYLDSERSLPPGYTENMILKIPSQDIMNKLMRSTLVLYSHDPDPDGLSTANVLRQSLSLIAKYPTIIAYGYQAKAHYFDKKSLYIHAPQPGIGTARNILHMIRPDNSYTKTEADILDLLMVIHAEHGGGNNSAFAARVVSSSGTDTYSAITAAVGALKGPKHGGASSKVHGMMVDMQEKLGQDYTKGDLRQYLMDLLNGKAYDGEGLIYGMGHAVYTLSDPRATLLRDKAEELAKEKNALSTFQLYVDMETEAKAIFKEVKGPDFEITANVDLYSGFVYGMLGIPSDLFTPLFAASRIVGWCAHRMEQMATDNKIMRPAYHCASPLKSYVAMKDR